MSAASRDDGSESLAPVIPLFGGSTARGGSHDEPDLNDPAAVSWRTTWTEPAQGDVRAQSDEPDEPDAAAELEAAEAALLRKLRTRSLSIREARAVLTERAVDAGAIDALVDRFVGNGYLDDAKLAEQLMHSAIERKGQGRKVIAQTLAKRGIPREVIDTALDELPDDDRDRALEFARGKARSMRSLDRDVALRRLAGQLARRGYGGQSFEAARRALDELDRPARPVVRFEP